MIKKYIFSISVLVSALCFSAFSFAETVWIDVRSAAEYEADHIHGDVRIDHTKIVKGVTALHPDKDTEIRLYCGSGRRADVAMSALRAAGYSKVSNAGGIKDARKERNLNQ